MIARCNFEQYLNVMRRNESGKRERDFRLGMRALASHRPDLALRSFRAAADACPATNPSQLSRHLYWLGVALLRLDRPELALKSLASAQKLRPRGVARRAYLLRINEYGMCKRASSELDDFYAFYAVQACAYLMRKSTRRFDSNAEKDAVTRLIGDAWHSLSRRGELVGLSSDSKLALFNKWLISFPLFDLDTSNRGVIIAADFRRGHKHNGNERCSCGSGLTYMRCCGRTGSPRERFCE
jgi:hypothetical protein